MAEQVVEGWARGIAAVAEAEGVLERVAGELAAFARAMGDHPQLRDRLTDPGVDPAGKLAAASDLLARAHPQTRAAALYIVQAGRARDLEDIARALLAASASRGGATVAEVRTALPLDAGQQQRLADAIQQTLRRPVQLQVITDATLVGGVSVRVGDTVLDGSLARRLDEVRAALTGA